MTIDRLPFPRPDDPLLQARRDRAGGRAFQLVDLPRAATLLAQGAGRLIRNADDRGVVAVLDPRLATASYRGVLLSDPAADAPLGGPLRGGVVPAAGARGQRGVGLLGEVEDGIALRVGPALCGHPQDPAAGYPAQLLSVERVGPLVPAHVADEQPGLGEEPEVA